MSKADIIRAYCLSKVGLPYQLGEEFDHPAGPIFTVREDGDCSGIFYAACMEADVKVGGRKVTRETADTYYRMSRPIAHPSRVGDCCSYPKTGRKTHVAVYIGQGQVFEAGNHGPGGVYPGHGYVGLCTVAQMDARHPVWGRLDVDIEEEEDDMTADEVNKLIDKRLELMGVSAEVTAAEKHLIKLGLLSKGRAPARALSWGLFVTMLSRTLKLLGK